MRAYKQPTQRSPERDRLIAEHVEVARRIAERVGRRVPEWVGRDDLVSAAMIGLAEAADRYDAERGEPFVGFAEKRIRGAVLDELRRGDVLSRRQRVQARKVGETIRALANKLGRDPEDEEIAAELGVSMEEYRSELEELTHVGCVELDVTTVDAGTHQSSHPDPATAAERALLGGRLRKALGTLSERDATLMSLYYNEDLSYAEIGKLLGITESRVCQLHSKALARLRAELSEGNR
jgi:RNA polymerase sigma factor FliA